MENPLFHNKFNFLEILKSEPKTQLTRLELVSHTIKSLISIRSFFWLHHLPLLFSAHNFAHPNAVPNFFIENEIKCSFHQLFQVHPCDHVTTYLLIAFLSLSVQKTQSLHFEKYIESEKNHRWYPISVGWTIIPWLMNLFFRWKSYTRDIWDLYPTKLHWFCYRARAVPKIK